MKAILLILFLLSSLRVVADPLSEAVDKVIDRSIPVISAKQLTRELRSPTPPVLLDSRERKEFQISHLPSAVLVGYERFSLNALKNVPKDSRIVIYCSIGYRSEKIGERLVAAGFTNVQNLFGGIFAWANGGGSLVDQAGQQTKAVHGYSKKWARLLDPGVPRVLD